MITKLMQYINKQNLKSNIDDEVIIMEIKEKAQKTYSVLILQGYNEKLAYYKTIQSLKTIYRNFKLKKVRYGFNNYQWHKFINILPILLNIINFLGYKFGGFTPLIIIIANIIIIVSLLWIKYYLLVKEIPKVKNSELKRYFENTLITAVITAMLLLNYLEKGMGLIIFAINIIYVIFNGFIVKRLFFLTIPGAIISILLFTKNINYFLFIQILIFVFLLYVVYLLLSVNFNFLINQFFGLISVFCLVFLVLWQTKLYIMYILPILLLAIGCLIMIKWKEYKFRILSIKVIITYYLGVIIGYYALSYTFTFLSNTTHESNYLLSDLYLIMIFLGLELVNNYAFILGREIQLSIKQYQHKEVNDG